VPKSTWPTTLSLSCPRRPRSGRTTPVARRRTTAPSPTPGGAELELLEIADPPEAWADLGFAVDGGSSWVSGTEHRLGAEGRRICGWRLTGASTSAVDGLPVSDGPALPPVAQSHPNGVIELDHLVVFTPDHQRTLDAIQGAGLDLRRIRDADTYEVPMRQGFFKLGSVILEVIGPVEPTGDGPARFFGLAFTVADLDATAAYLGDRLRPSKAAVQSGRRIATLDKNAGSTVAIAFMS
jgi:hypothetical protein